MPLHTKNENLSDIIIVMELLRIDSQSSTTMILNKNSYDLHKYLVNHTPLMYLTLLHFDMLHTLLVL